MPTITLQVGQCGNQVGQVLFERLSGQAGAAGAEPAAAAEFFRSRHDGRRTARCLLVDTEPKVVNAVLAADKEGLFTRQQCYLGQSGRGNNWAFGYNQLSLAAPQQPHHQQQQQRPQSAQPGGGGWRSGTALGPAWVSSTATEDPSRLEFRILEHVYDGIRREAEAADGCPSFLLLHSLGGGSGSGMGSRVLEHLRDEYPLSYIAAASIAPRATGECTTAAFNTVMALSFLQAYADAVLLFNNQDLMDACQRPSLAAMLPTGGGGGGGASGAGGNGTGSGMDDVNRLVGHYLTGALWPLDATDALGGVGRLRDMVNSIAADPCTKLLQTWTAHSAPSVPVASLWTESLRGLSSLLPRADPLRANAPITTAGALLLARGYPAGAMPGAAATGGGGGGAAAAAAAPLADFVRSLGAQGAAPTLTPEASLFLRRGKTGIVRELKRSIGAAAGGAKPPPSVAAAPPPSLTAICNRSNTIGVLETAVQRALAACDAGAYLHWYARHGCSEDAIREAAGTLLDVASCYRQLHRVVELDAA